MVKKRGLVTGLMFVFILAFVNVFLFFNKGRTSYTGISGLFVKELPQLPFELDISFIIFISQWIILASIVLVIYARFLKSKRDDITKQDYYLIKHKKTKSETDLDVLYTLLKKKRKLNIGTVSVLFNISKDKSLEWARILENHELAVIDYPTFSAPEVKINEKEKQEERKEEEQKGERETEKEDRSGKQEEKEEFDKEAGEQKTPEDNEEKD